MAERRKFERLGKKFPIRCKVVHKKKKFPISGVIEAYSQNISQGGLLLGWPRGWKCNKCLHCLSWLFNLNCKLKEKPYQEATRLLDSTTFLKLEIASPIFPKPINTYARVVWIKETQFPHEDTYNVGIAFTKPLKNRISPRKAK